MEVESPSQSNQQPKHPPLQVNFSWKKFKSTIIEKKLNGQTESRPLYILKYRTMRPNLVFCSPTDKSVIGSSNFNLVSINSTCVVRGKPTSLMAQKRFATNYVYDSQVLKDNNNINVSATMKWITIADTKYWHFICLGPEEMPVAKFAANLWSYHRVGTFEFTDPRCTDELVRDELVITGMTVFYCMLLRINNPCQLIGALFLQKSSHVKQN